MGEKIFRIYFYFKSFGLLWVKIELGDFKLGSRFDVRLHYQVSQVASFVHCTGTC